MEMKLEDFIQLSGPLFEAVQLGQIFPDGKTFVDAIPKGDPKEILEAYTKEKEGLGFDLNAFVLKHFDLPKEEEVSPPNAQTMDEYIEGMWPLLRKEMKDPSEKSTLISLPHPHIVPGGRFRECFYWDSYFTALGLPLSFIKEMALNFASLIDRFGMIPNGNRVYFTSRSQPPYFSHLLKLLIEKGEESFARRFAPHLEKEYHYWMSHSDEQGLCHYFDELHQARPEAYLRETTLKERCDHPHFYCHLRAACASGWDFSSRWLKDQKSFSTIWALDILPIDLNCLLYHIEETLFTLTKQTPYKEAATSRKRAIQTLFWHEDFFWDLHAPTMAPTKATTLAGVMPLFTGIATEDQAQAVATRIEKEFLLPGGFVTSLTEGIHQWDMPNGWAPLQWITIQGLHRYGFSALALEGAKRWLALNKKIFQETGTLLEKYNVRTCSAEVARGEYALQQGFGWTNGVATALKEFLNPF